MITGKKEEQYQNNTVTAPGRSRSHVFFHFDHNCKFESLRYLTKMADNAVEAPVVNKNKRHRKEKRMFWDHYPPNGNSSSFQKHGIQMTSTSEHVILLPLSARYSYRLAV